MPLALTELTPDVVARAADGDRRAVEEIVRALQRPLYNVALRMLLDPGDAEDATQEALLRIVTHLSEYRGEARFSTWAWRIAIRRVLDVRGRRRSSFATFAADLEDGLVDEAVERPDDALLLRQLKLICSQAMLQCLDPEQRIAFILCGVLELSAPEAAEILELEPATVRKRLSRARAALAAFLGRHCGVFAPGAACACHRRLDRAVALGRVRRDALDVREGDLPALRAQLATIDELRRVTEFFNRDPEVDGRRDLVAALRATLSAKELS